MTQPAPIQRPRFLSAADCQDIAQRLQHFAKGEGDTVVSITSLWTGNVRWARNRITTTGEDRNNRLVLTRSIRGASNRNMNECFNEVSDPALVAALRRAERGVHGIPEQVDADLFTRADSPFRVEDEPAAIPQLFFESTYQLDAGHRAEAARHLVQSAAAAGMLSAGYIEVSANSQAYITSWGYTKYYQYTWAQCSMTVRDPKGVGSGWAGVDWPDWSRIEGEKLAAIALDKCLKSRNPVAVEPGRYTTILEPQAVCDFIGLMMFYSAIGREVNETQPRAPFHKSGDREPPDQGSNPLGYSRLGERVIDERITISADPMDPDLGFPPYPNDLLGAANGTAYHPAVWFEHGVLQTEEYDRLYAIKELGRNTGLLNSGAFRMSVNGTTTPIEEMIATTKRGLIVTRFDQVLGPEGAALLCRGYTRDGFWLIENGRISRPVKNMLFVESILFALNNVEQFGVSQRVFHPPVQGELLGYLFTNHPQPAIVPPLKIRDFSFTALSDSI